MLDGRMFGMIPGDAKNAGCGFWMLDSCRVEMPDGRMLEEPGDAGRVKDAGRAWRCQKSKMQEEPGDAGRAWRCRKMLGDAGRAWRCRKSLEMPEDAGRCLEMMEMLEDAWRCQKSPNAVTR